MPQLLIRVTATGEKTFYVRRHKDAGTDRVLIGSFPDVTVEQARRMAQQIAASLVMGEDPHQDRLQARKELTLGELLDAYIEDYAKLHCLAWSEMNAVFRRDLLLGARASSVQSRRQIFRTD